MKKQSTIEIDQADDKEIGIIPNNKGSSDDDGVYEG